MDSSSIPGIPNSPLPVTAVLGDNAQDLLSTGANVQRGATIVVNSIDDAVNPSSGVTTLRDAINKADTDSQKDLIVFDRSLFSKAQTITLTGGELDITHDLNIVAPRDTLTGADLVTVSGNEASRVFEIESGATVKLSGLIVADGSVTRDDGGGIKNSGTLTLDSSIVRNNSANAPTVSLPFPLIRGYGGGIYSIGTLTVNNSTISSNLANTGGGISSTGTATVENSIISGNSASFNFGGGIGNNHTLTVKNTTISGNSAKNDAGGIYSGGQGIGSNEVLPPQRFAGTLTVENSTITGNSATQNGGGISSNGTTTVENSTITGNSAKNNGGGIYNAYTGTLTLLFSTVTQNIAANGGGVYQNNAPAVPPFLSIRGSFNVRNTIIALNLNSAGGVNPDVSGTFTSLGYNIVGTSTGSTGFGVTGDIVGTSTNPIDPHLGTLANNGGPTQTIALLKGSPAINAGDPTILPTDPTTDQRGKPRVRRGRADIGAFESNLKA